MQRQKDWFDKLAKAIHEPIYTAKNYLDDKKYRPGKQHPIGKQPPPIDHRTIGSNEVILELDFKTYATNAKYAHILKDHLEASNIPHYPFWSGNKSVHLHIWCDLEITTKDCQNTVKEAIDAGCNIYCEIRTRIAEDIVTQAGISKDLIGIGKNKIDIAKLRWNDLGGSRSLIRACGGANKKIDPIIKLTTCNYKTYTPIIPLKLSAFKKSDGYEEVTYPDSIELYKVPESLIYEVAQNYLNRLTKTDKRELNQIAYAGKYLKLASCQQILEGLPSGKRGFGAQVLAIACRLDGLSLNQCKTVLTEYAQNCPQVPDTFEPQETFGWAKWVYMLPNPYWSCAQPKRLDCHNEHTCEYCQEKYKEELNLFNVNEPLNVIKEALDKTIVGEDDLKMQLFLLYLTKDIGPEYCILIEGSAATGKTHTMKEVAKLFGETEYKAYSRITGAALERGGESLAEEWNKKIIIIEELQGMNEKVAETLRVLISEKQLNLLSPEETKMSDGTTKQVTTDAKPIMFDCLFVMCNAENFDKGDQLKSRSWILNTDASPSQNNAVMDDKIDKDAVASDPPDFSLISDSLQRLRKPSKVVVPFKEVMKKYVKPLFPMEEERSRRDLPKLQKMIHAIAYFNGNKRKWDGDVLYANIEDAYLALKIAGNALIATSRGLGVHDIEFYNEVRRGVVRDKGEIDSAFFLEDVRDWSEFKSRTTILKKLNSLKEAGYLDVHQPGPGVKAIYTLQPHSANPDIEPTLEALKELVEQEKQGDNNEV